MRFLVIVILFALNFSRISAQNNPKNSDTVVHIFEKVEIEAMVLGDETTWRKYLEKYMNFMVPYNNGAPIGKYTVIVRFIVDENGNVADVNALTNFGYGMEEEAVRLINKGPKWIAAKQNGKFVKSYQMQPITFVVLGDEIEITSKSPYQLYTGIENIMTIKVENLDEKDIKATISQGSIVSIGNNEYKVLVDVPGSAIISVFNIKEKNKKIGSAYFFVKSEK